MKKMILSFVLATSLTASISHAGGDGFILAALCLTTSSTSSGGASATVRDVETRLGPDAAKAAAQGCLRNVECIAANVDSGAFPEIRKLDNQTKERLSHAVGLRANPRVVRQILGNESVYLRAYTHAYKASI